MSEEDIWRRPCCMNEKKIKNEQVNIGHLSGDIMEFMMNQLPEKLKGISFVETSIEILTLCLSTIIKSGYCHAHYQYALDKAIEQINRDLETNK